MATVQPLPLDFDFETPELLKATITAARALSKLQGIAQTIPNQEILLSTLILQEAQESSAIENIITTQKDLLVSRGVAAEKLNPSVKEVRRYEDAVRLGFNLVKEEGLVLTRHIVKVQKLLKGDDAGLRRVPGTVLRNAKTGEIVHEPPQHIDEINTLMGNLEQYLNNASLQEIDPLIKMAVIHHQFETIHPFFDGNGRTGRILNVLYLIKEGLLDLPILYLSRFIVEHKGEYYRHLAEARLSEKGYQSYVLWMLEGVRITANFTVDVIERLRDLMKNYKQRLRALDAKVYSQDLLNNIFKYPYTKVAFVMEDLSVTRPTATRYLKVLVDAGLLEVEQIGRNKFYINSALLELLTRPVMSDNEVSIESVNRD
ncbi:MAG: Fic family protein [Saprospiraceae bacterium]